MESNGRLDKDTFGIYDVDSKRADSVTREPPHMSIIKSSSMPQQELPPAEQPDLAAPPPGSTPQPQPIPTSN
jgi:hypothetical protein